MQQSAARTWALTGAGAGVVALAATAANVSALSVVATIAAVGACVLAVREAGQGASSPSSRDGAANGDVSLGQVAPLLEALPDPALLIDREGRIAGSNAAARRQLQFEASGLRLSAILRNPELLDAVQAAADDGVSRTVAYEVSAPVEEHFKTYVAPIAWGRDVGALMVFHDQTAMMATERMRADFLANASHELKTPLASLTLLIETLVGPARADPEAQTQFFAMMQVQAARMRRLIEDLLSLSKIELNEHVPPTDRANLVDVVREAASIAAPVAKERDIRIEVDAPAATIVVGERFQLAQVVQNLIDNAIKYSPNGGVVRLRLGVAPDREAAVAEAGRRWDEAGRIALLSPPPGQGAFVFLRVEDEGAGIARRHLPRLSERFYRVERDDGPQREGTGLGLAIVKHIVNRHRGGLLVESVVGQGSAFAVVIRQAADAPGIVVN
ncbi:MAG: PAS domain-containing protein [Alphaproteobacteria bacterium]|nr:PAS domain-containing protein [Alphaproteobacteria bacterium]